MGLVDIRKPCRSVDAAVDGMFDGLGPWCGGHPQPAPCAHDDDPQFLVE
jgi:hypothetical protein